MATDEKCCSCIHREAKKEIPYLKRILIHENFVLQESIFILSIGFFMWKIESVRSFV